MLIFPAIDLYEGKAVRLYQGDYARMTVYSEHPEEIGVQFAAAGAKQIHLVDLEGAKDGTTPNFETVCAIKRTSGCFCEIGGGIRSMEVIERYLAAGIDRVILGTAAVKDRAFLQQAVTAFGARVAVGVDIKDGAVAVKGWTENSGLAAMEFCTELQQMGIKTIICTDISRDGAMRGTNRELYRTLSQRCKMQIVASGGVSDLEDIRALRALELYGAIIGKACYTGAIDLKEAIEAAT